MLAQEYSIAIEDRRRTTTMALGKRKDEQQEMWVATTSLPKSQGHVFYRKLNEVFAEAGFDRMAEELCRSHYHSRIGRPSIPPGVYFRMLLVGYFEGIGSQRGIAWRCADSLSLREFLGVPLTEDAPDHSSLTRVRDRLPLEVHAAVFEWALRLVAEKGLLPGKTAAIDSTFLEANAAMKSIVRRDTGEDWNDYLRRLLKEQQGVENPTDDELRRFDRTRKDKRVSNEEWVSTTDPDSRIAKMKNGETHLAYKAEHVIDLDTEVVLAASIYPADYSDVDTMVDSVVDARVHLTEAGVDVEIEEAVADKGYHATDTIELAESLDLRTYIPERKSKGKRNWCDVPEEKRRAVLNNRRRVRRAKSKRLQRQRSERVERSFAHICETGGARRSWLHGLEKVQKRYSIAAMARNLGLLMRKVFGIGTPRGLQAAGGLASLVLLAWIHIQGLQHRYSQSHSFTSIGLSPCATAA
jgi:transposase